MHNANKPTRPHLLPTALITMSTRASLKKYHTFNLVLGMGKNGDEWEYERIGTEREKMHVERELHELRERLAMVEGWKKRRKEIDDELAKVWVEGGEELEIPGEPEGDQGGGKGQREEQEREGRGLEQSQDTSSVVVVSERAVGSET